jgi:hypothetical protein
MATQDRITKNAGIQPPARSARDESERPIRMAWKLEHRMPVEMIEENR